MAEKCVCLQVQPVLWGFFVCFFNVFLCFAKLETYSFKIPHSVVFLMALFLRMGLVIEAENGLRKCMISESPFILVLEQQVLRA